jgi:sRNA-binding protein
LTKEIIEKAVKAYTENDAYWLKFQHFAGEVDMAVFNKLQAKHIEYRKELDEF